MVEPRGPPECGSRASQASQASRTTRSCVQAPHCWGKKIPKITLKRPQMSHSGLYLPYIIWRGIYKGMSHTKAVHTKLDAARYLEGLGGALLMHLTGMSLVWLWVTPPPPKSPKKACVVPSKGGGLYAELCGSQGSRVLTPQCGEPSQTPLCGSRGKVPVCFRSRASRGEPHTHPAHNPASSPCCGQPL